MLTGQHRQQNWRMNNNNKNRKENIGRLAISAINLGWEMALPIFIGVLLGKYLDGLTNSRFHLTLSLLVGGVFISYYNLAKYIKRFDKKENKDDKPDR